MEVLCQTLQDAEVSRLTVAELLPHPASALVEPHLPSVVNKCNDRFTPPTKRGSHCTPRHCRTQGHTNRLAGGLILPSHQQAGDRVQR
jgi:hypothetical protein